jgi:hypothetical protein
MAQGSRWLVMALVLAGLTARADADIFKVFGEAHGGGVFGKGLSGDPVEAGPNDEAFFANVPHLAYGARIGARFLIFEGAIQHHQFANGSRLSTWTQFAVGVGLQPELGDEKARKAHTGGFVEAGVDVGFGLGTGQQVDPPLSNDEITDKAVLIEGRFGFGKHLNKVFDIGVVVPVSWGYFIKTGFDTPANDVSNHYKGLQIEALAYLRLNIKLL